MCSNCRLFRNSCSSCNRENRSSDSTRWNGRCGCGCNRWF